MPQLIDETRIGWLVHNGSGWNHHKTADILNEILASAPDELPAVPNGYAVLVAPVSDKPFGLRCALVEVLSRRTVPLIGLHEAGGNYLSGERVRAVHNCEPEEMETVAQATAYLTTKGYTATSDRPPGWPEGFNFLQHTDGTWASIEMCDDGCDGDADGWARDRFSMDVEIIKSVKAEQQTDDDSDFFIRTMTEAIISLKL